MKKLSRKLRLNTRSIQILDDRSLVDLRGGAGRTTPKTCLEDSCKDTCAHNSCKEEQF